MRNRLPVIVLGLAMAISSLFATAAPSPVAAEERVSSCTRGPVSGPFMTFTQVRATGSGVCRPRGTVIVEIVEYRAPYLPRVVATARCTTQGSTCYATAVAARRFDASYQARLSTRGW